MGWRRKIQRIPGVRRAVLGVLRRYSGVSLALVKWMRFDRMPASVAVQLAYQVILDRSPDPSGMRTWLPRLIDGTMSKREMVNALRGSPEFERNVPFSADTLGPSIHLSRSRFIRALPPAKQIVDLGGTSLGNVGGAMVMLGYPHTFDSLTIVDLPPDERHELYRGDRYESIETPSGLVSYHYHSMVDLSAFKDNSTDLVYSGQSIEHVEAAEGAKVAQEVMRILRPGGYFALDTPNGRVTRLQQDDFIDPDHKIEYTWPGLKSLLVATGFEIDWSVGLNYAGGSIEAGRFDADEVARNPGIFYAIENCYILAVIARKPGSVMSQ